MFYQTWATDKKYESLSDLSDQELLDRIREFPSQDLLNNKRDGSPRTFQVGRTADQYAGRELDSETRENLLVGFSSLTTLTTGIQGQVNMPDNLLARDMWNFYEGGIEGQAVDLGFTEEAPGRIAVSVPTRDLGTVKIGYLDEEFVNAHPIKGGQIVNGQWNKGQLEIVLDAEELYRESRLEPVLTDDGKYAYERSFAIDNIQYETDSWGSHEANPGILKDFERNMNAFPVKEMLGDMLEKNGQENPIVDASWIAIPDKSFRLQILTDKPFDGAQLLCLDNTLDYLTRKSAYNENRNNHIFGKYMDTDDDFLKAVQESFKTNMYPSCDDLFTRKGCLAEVKIEPELTLTNEDLAGLMEPKDMSI